MNRSSPSVGKKQVLCLLFTIGLVFPNIISAQPAKKSNSPSPSAQAKLNAEMEKAMKNMSPAERERMKKMMGDIMPTMLENADDYRYPEITNNHELIPKKDIGRLNAIPKTRLTQSDILAYTNSLLSKLMTKAEPSEIAIIKAVAAKGNSTDHFGNAAILCMMQGHSQAAMGLSMKAVQANPKDLNCQNNMASLLTQYGYPEQAIPLLQKLGNEFPDNSTILNNLAQAWFGLGQLDSAYNFTMAACKTNPSNPDAQALGGIIEESRGNTEAATKHFTNALQNSQDPLAENLLKNNAGANAINNIDYEKLKKSITIYAYFPKNWIEIPVLSDNVSGYENDRAIQNGYAKMLQELEKEIKATFDMSKIPLEESLKKGKEEFAKEMMKEGLGHGHSFITTPARIIISLITIKLHKLSKEYSEEKKKLDDLIKEKIKEKIAAEKNGQCGVQDRLNNQFLADVNPMLRNMFAKYIEEYRIWLNAFCTWTWYLTGNVKDVSLSQCIAFTGFYADLFRDAIESQKTAFPCGKEGVRGDRVNKTTMPAIPSFFCPTVVAVPMGMDWHVMDNTLKNLNANSLGINKIPGAPVPNMSIAYGIGGSHIAQPGKAAFTKAAQGTWLPVYGGTPLKEYEPELAPLSPTKEQKEKLKRDYESTNNTIDRIIKQGLNKMMTADCDALKKLKESDNKKITEAIKKKMLEAMKDEYELEQLKKEVEQIKKELRENEQIIKNIDDAVRKGMVEALDNMEVNISKGTITPTLNSGIQAPNTFSPQPGLFK